MPDRADAHIHLFEGGYGGSFAARPGVRIDEAACYASLAADHGVTAALIVGYTDAPWARTNTEYLARMVQEHAWVRPLAYVDPAQPPTVENLERLRSQGFCGISLYISGEERVDALLRIPGEVWDWLTVGRCLVSVNSSGKDWGAWSKILERYGDLTLIVSHVGLPPRVSEPPTEPESRRAMADVVALAEFPGPRVKLSGFYALTEPGYDYPHRAAWPYVESLLEAYGVGRLLWASDFSPSLDWLTFPQTFGLFSHMPFLSDSDRAQIEGANLLALLEGVAT